MNRGCGEKEIGRSASFEDEVSPAPGLEFSTPLLNAAGSLGFSLPGRGAVDPDRLGAFFTNPVSLAPRRPAENRCLVPFPGGFLLHTGLPNPGFRSVLRAHAFRWARMGMPVIVHLIASQPEELARMVRRLEGLEGVSGIEVGLHPEISPDQAARFYQAARGELAVIASLPPDRVVDLGPALQRAGAGLVSLAAPRGALPGPEGRLIHGRLYGPALLPGALQAVAAAAGLGLRVIGSGGVYAGQDGREMLSAGACAVQVDAAWWKGFEIEDW